MNVAQEPVHGLARQFMIKHVAESVWNEAAKYIPSDPQPRSQRYSEIQDVYASLLGFPHDHAAAAAGGDPVQFVDVLLCVAVEVEKKHLLVFLLADFITKRMNHILSERLMKTKQKDYHGLLFQTLKMNRPVVEESDGDDGSIAV